MTAYFQKRDITGLSAYYWTLFEKKKGIFKQIYFRGVSYQHSKLWIISFSEGVLTASQTAKNSTLLHSSNNIHDAIFIIETKKVAIIMTKMILLLVEEAVTQTLEGSDRRS